jgi:hypothetical protein
MEALIISTGLYYSFSWLTLEKVSCHGGSTTGFRKENGGGRRGLDLSDLNTFAIPQK